MLTGAIQAFAANVNLVPDNLSLVETISCDVS